MPGTLLHRLAACVLRAGILLAPGDASEWGRAMLGELQHIEGNWAALAWALGGAGVLAKQALVALLLPARNGQSAALGNPLSGEDKMHKASLIMGGACLAAVLLFFLAPVFRQGFHVSLAQWHSVIHVGQSSRSQQAKLGSFARRVEKNQDAEGMAFVAARMDDPAESARLAEEAVRLDPGLMWILGVVAAHHPNAPQVPKWVLPLEQWDAGNAMPYLILAQREDAKRMGAGGSTLHPLPPSATWLEAMEGAFSSIRIDDYSERLRAIDRKVARRYGLIDPYFVVEMWHGFPLPDPMGWDATRYAKLAIASGDALQARGDLQGAIEKYLKVARFLPLIDSHIRFSFFVDNETPGLYERLATAYRKTQNEPQSTYFAGLAATAKSEMRQRLFRLRSTVENRRGLFGVTPWSALTVELSDAGMLASFCLLLIALIVILAQSGKPKPRKARMGPVATVLGLLGSVGLLVSSVTLYVAYSPYAAIYSRFLQTGDTSQLKILSDFLEFTRTPIGTQAYRPSPMVGGHTMLVPYISAHTFTFYFWLTVTVLGVGTLAAIGGFYLLKRQHPHSGAAA